VSRGAPLIVCDGLVKIYSVGGREVVALQGLELAVDEGEMLGIVGPSGAGKSTLLNVVGGLDRPSAGLVMVGDAQLGELSDAALDHYRREQTGFVWQLPGRNLLPHLSAQENLALPQILASLPADQRDERAAGLLAAVGLSDRADHLPVEMSGGEQQRLAIAVALANRPQLLLADEPTGELDSVTAGEVFSLLRRLNEEYGLTVVVVSHDQGIARAVDRVVAIRDGRTSTETRAVAGGSGGRSQAGRQEFETEELVVVDSAGRLQLPKDTRERHRIGGLARLEDRPDGILVQRAETKKQHKQGPS
jgi:putative ABC transport system ATP-binding protein